MSLSPGTWVALAAAFVIVTLLLTLTAVTLISQREKTVLLNKQIATLISEATVVLHGVAPVLNAVPAHSSTIKGRANALAHLVSQAGPLIGQLNATGMPGTLAETGQLVYFAATARASYEHSGQRQRACVLCEPRGARHSAGATA